MRVVLHGPETKSIIFREECRLTVVENRVLGKECGSRQDEVAWELRIIHNEELYDLY